MAELKWVITQEVVVDKINGKYVIKILDNLDMIDEDLRDRLYEENIHIDDIIKLAGIIDDLIEELRDKTPLAYNMNKEDDSQSWDDYFDEQIDFFSIVTVILNSIFTGEDMVMKACY